MAFKASIAPSSFRLLIIIYRSCSVKISSLNYNFKHFNNLIVVSILKTITLVENGVLNINKNLFILRGYNR